MSNAHERMARRQAIIHATGRRLREAITSGTLSDDARAKMVALILETMLAAGHHVAVAVGAEAMPCGEALDRQMSSLESRLTELLGALPSAGAPSLS